MESENFKSATPIQNFYAGQNVLITGGTGFLGKVLIEKLLRCCAELASIYVIIRPKGDHDIHRRMESVFEEPGNCALPNFGISAENRDILINKISIVFHAAANVKFNDKLGHLIADNIFGTKQLIDICRSMKNLKVFMYTSTYYAHTHRVEINEKIYDPSISADKILKLAEIFDTGELEKFENILREDYPNNYGFSKAIAEHLIKQSGNEFPVGIFRPAVVVATCKSPMEGWTDNFYGPTGMIAAASIGALRIMQGDLSKRMEIVPADLTINALIACAWDVALNKTKEDDPWVYNYIATWNNPITWGLYCKLCHKYNVPPLNSIQCYNLKVYKNYYAYCIAQTIFQTLPAIVIDAYFIIIGKKTRAVKYNKKLSNLAKTFSYFTLKDWRGEIDRTKSLWKRISPDDQKIFPFSMDDFDWNDYIRKYMLSIRLYVLKDPVTTIPAARKRQKK